MFYEVESRRERRVYTQIGRIQQGGIASLFQRRDGAASIGSVA